MSTSVMKSLRFTEFGPPSVLRIEEVPIPEPGEGEALVQVKAAAINPKRHRECRGTLQEHDTAANPGRDFAGIAVKGTHHEGAEVWGSYGKLGIVNYGSHAEYVVVAAETLSLKPKSLSMARAAAIGVPYITAWASVVSATQIQPGETFSLLARRVRWDKQLSKSRTGSRRGLLARICDPVRFPAPRQLSIPRPKIFNIFNRAA